MYVRYMGGGRESIQVYIYWALSSRLGSWTAIFRVSCLALWLQFDMECLPRGGERELERGEEGGGSGGGGGREGDLPFKEIYLKLELKESGPEVLLENLHKIRQGIYRSQPPCQPSFKGTLHQ
jgi:hypothetical protein